MRAFRFEVRLDQAIEAGADREEMAEQYERPPEEWELYRPVYLWCTCRLGGKHLEFSHAISGLLVSDDDERWRYWDPWRKCRR